MTQGCDSSEGAGGDILRALSAKALAAGVPIAAGIELTERCNLRCVHCYLGDQEALRARRRDELSTDQWKGVLDEIASLGCLRLLITGGDPLLRPDFADIYRHAVHKGLLVTVFTNGTLITERVLELFREFPPYSIEVSVYGVSPEVYEGITSVKGSFEACMQGVDALRGQGFGLGLKSVLMRPNRDEFGEIAGFCRERGERPFRFDSQVHGGFTGSTAPLEVRLSPREAVEVEFSDPQGAESWRHLVASRKGVVLDESNRLYSCGAARGFFHVDPYGQIHPCVSVRHIQADSRALGVTGALKAIRDRISAIVRPAGMPCNECEYRAVCGACPAFSLLEGGLEDQPARFQCQMTQMRAVKSSELGEIQ